MLALEGMMNAQRNRGMYLRVGERLAGIRKSRKISQAKLAKLLGVVEGTIQNYEHGRNEPNITRLYDAKRGRQPRVEYICRHSQQQTACLPVVPIGKQAQIRNVVVCHFSVSRCEYAFRSTLASGSPARCAPLPKPRISACSTFNSPKPTVTISAMSAADKPPEQTMDHSYALKKSMSHADECVRLAGLTDDLIVRDQL